MTIRHVLLIPAPGDPAGLLRSGPCGARPPTVIRLTRPCDMHDASRRCGDWRVWGRLCDTALSSERALVLAWDGEAVPEGCDRALRAAWEQNSRTDNYLRYHYSMDDALNIARACEAAGLGTAVVEDTP